MSATGPSKPHFPWLRSSLILAWYNSGLPEGFAATAALVVAAALVVLVVAAALVVVAALAAAAVVAVGR